MPSPGFLRSGRRRTLRDRNQHWATLAAVRLTPGTRVGPYEVGALLGAGGMAEVYRAKDTRLGRDVAVKVVSEALGGDEAFLERFDREAKLAASLAHPNVVALHDVGIHDGKPYFVTELLQGESLRERLAKGPIPLARALEWAAQMAQGLAAAHERGIVHRDLKPENVFITRDGHVKLLDFGIAKLIETAQAATPHGLMDPTVSPSGSSTGTGMVLGTPGYMSPEQVRGDPVDARTDFFSLGAVLYEMLSGHRAFSAGPVVETGYAVLHNEPEPLPVTVPPQVAQVAHRCLEKDPARRFQSARDLAFNIELLRAPTGSTTPKPTSLGVPAQPSAGKRWPLLLVALGAAPGATGVTAYFVGASKRNPTPSVEQVTFQRGFVSAARFNPEGRVVLSAAWHGQPTEVFTRPAGSPEAQPLGLRNAELLGVSATGELAVQLHTGPSGRGTLAIVPGAGGAPREVAEDVYEADWSPTGELAAVRKVGTSWRLEFPLGTPVFETASAGLSRPRVSPRGDNVAFIVQSPSVPAWDLMVVDRQGRARKLSTTARTVSYTNRMASGLAWAPRGDEVWFDDHNAIWASRLSGGRRLIYQAVAGIHLEDISRDGRVLVNGVETRIEIVFLPPDQKKERLLTWLSQEELAALSGDGRQVLFTSFPAQEPFTYLRATDGSPAVKLGAGLAFDLSSDAKWVVSGLQRETNALSLLPVRAGSPTTISVPSLKILGAKWLHDGTRIVVMAQRPNDNRLRLFIVPIDGGDPVSLSEVVRSNFEVSQDDRFVAAGGTDAFLTVYPLDGGAPVRLPELGKDTGVIRWTPEGQLWVTGGRLTSIRLLRFDIGSRRVVEERNFAPTESTDLNSISRVKLSADGRAVAFNYPRTLSNLYILDGLAPPRR